MRFPKKCNIHLNSFKQLRKIYFKYSKLTLPYKLGPSQNHRKEGSDRIKIFFLVFFLLIEWESQVSNSCETKVEISAGDLTLGDIVEVKAGEMIPADIRIIKSDGFKVKANTYNINYHDQTKTTYHHLRIS